MHNEQMLRLATIHPIWAPGLTIMSCGVVVAACLTGNWVLVMLAAIAVPLAIAAAIQVSAVAPLATEVLRLREEVTELQGRHGAP